MIRNTTTFLTQQQSDSEVGNINYNNRMKKQGHTIVPTMDDLREILKKGIRKMMLEK